MAQFRLAELSKVYSVSEKSESKFVRIKIFFHNLRNTDSYDLITQFDHSLGIMNIYYLNKEIPSYSNILNSARFEDLK